MELVDRLRDVAAVVGVCAFAMTLVLHGPHRTSLAARDVIDAAMEEERE